MAKQNTRMYPGVARAKRGASATGYALVVGLVAVVAISAISQAGSSVSGLLDGASNSMVTALSGDGEGVSVPAPSISASATPSPSPALASYRYWRMRSTSVADRYVLLEMEMRDAMGSDMTWYNATNSHCAFANTFDTLDPVHGAVNDVISTSAGQGWEARNNTNNLAGDYIGCDLGSSQAVRSFVIWPYSAAWVPDFVFEGADSQSGPYQPVASFSASGLSGSGPFTFTIQ